MTAAVHTGQKKTAAAPISARQKSKKTCLIKKINNPAYEKITHNGKREKSKTEF